MPGGADTGHAMGVSDLTRKAIAERPAREHAARG
jgi:hypothetical protein